ncbi:MAG: flagellar biosynthetic protein FliQ [Candidatus Sericytochromatia bacterium]
MALTLAYYSLSLLITLALPLLVTALIIGFVVSLFQAVSSVQEQTLSAVPKMIGVFGLIFAIAPWLLKNMLTFLTYIYSNIPIFLMR